MAYTFDNLFAADPSNPTNVAANASILLYDPADPTKAPVTITDPTGSPIPNPVTVNKNGFGPAMQHATLDRLAWEGGGFSNFITSYEGIKNEAVSARTAAQEAAATAGADAVVRLDELIAAGEFEGPTGPLTNLSIGTVEATPGNPLTDEIIASEITSGTATTAALSATIATATSGKLDATVAAAKYAKVAPAKLAPGARWGALGDSISNGSSASNFAYSYFPQAVQIVGGMVARPDSIEAGVPGERSDQALLRLPALLTAGAQAIVVLLGANDAEQSVPLATFKANMIAIIEQAKAGGCPVVLCTVPPRAVSVAAATRSRVDGYNDWIRTAATQYGCELADVYSALVDTTTGGMLAAYDVDNIHPNDLGHQKIGIEVAKAMKRCAARTTAYGLVRTASPANLITDPLAVGGTVRPAGWFEQPGGTGTAPTYSLVSDTSGVLPAGRWAQMDFDATAAGGIRTLSSNAMTAFTAGDRLLYAAHIQIEDVTGTWAADVSAGTASIAALIVNSATGTAIVSTPPLVRAPGIPSATAGVHDIGPVVFPITVPAGPTSLVLWFQLKLPTGKRVKLRVGCVGVINATARGAQAEFNWGSSIVNT